MNLSHSLKTCWHWLTQLGLGFFLGEGPGGQPCSSPAKMCDRTFKQTSLLIDMTPNSGYLGGWLLRHSISKINWWKCRGTSRGSAHSRHSVSFNCPSRMQEGISIGLTGSPGIWEPWRERGHVTSTHHQLYQILLAQLAGSGVISQFPKVPGEISCSVGPSSKRTGDRFKGWSGLLGSDKE